MHVYTNPIGDSQRKTKAERERFERLVDPAFLQQYEFSHYIGIEFTVADDEEMNRLWDGHARTPLEEIWRLLPDAVYRDRQTGHRLLIDFKSPRSAARNVALEEYLIHRALEVASVRLGQPLTVVYAYLLEGGVEWKQPPEHIDSYRFPCLTESGTDVRWIACMTDRLDGVQAAANWIYESAGHEYRQNWRSLTPTKTRRQKYTSAVRVTDTPFINLE